MTFSENYLNHLRVLQNIGMTRIDEVDYEGKKIVPIKFLKALLRSRGRSFCIISSKFVNDKNFW